MKMFSVEAICLPLPPAADDGGLAIAMKCDWSMCLRTYQICIAYQWQGWAISSPSLAANSDAITAIPKIANC